MSRLDRFIAKHWYKSIPSECTKLDKADSDCLERNLPTAKLCPSCAEYNRILTLWGSQEMPVHARVAVAVQNKADAIACGDYDKDVDWNLQDRVLWAARLYSAADKIRARKPLTLAELDEVQHADNYLPQDVDSVFFIRDLKTEEA